MLQVCSRTKNHKKFYVIVSVNWLKDLYKRRNSFYDLLHAVCDVYYIGLFLFIHVNIFKTKIYRWNFSLWLQFIIQLSMHLIVAFVNLMMIYGCNLLQFIEINRSLRNRIVKFYEEVWNLAHKFYTKLQKRPSNLLHRACVNHKKCGIFNM